MTETNSEMLKITMAQLRAFNLKTWFRASIGFLYAYENHILPLEVKSGWVTRSQSLNKYAEKYKPSYRTTFSAKPLCIDVEHRYHNYPLYMAHWFPLRV